MAAKVGEHAHHAQPPHAHLALVTHRNVLLAQRKHKLRVLPCWSLRRRSVSVSQQKVRACARGEMPRQKVSCVMSLGEQRGSIAPMPEFEDLEGVTSLRVIEQAVR